MKSIKINIILLSSILLGILIIFYFTIINLSKNETEYVEIIKENKVTDTVFLEKIIKDTVYIPKYITKIEKDTVEIEVISEKRIPITNAVYVDKVIDNTVDTHINESKLFLGVGYQYDLNNYFSGANLKLLYKTPKDKMVSLDVGVRNDLLNKETGVGELRPYLGASIYFRLDNLNK